MCGLLTNIHHLIGSYTTNNQWDQFVLFAFKIWYYVQSHCIKVTTTMDQLDSQSNLHIEQLWILLRT